MSLGERTPPHPAPGGRGSCLHLPCPSTHALWSYPRALSGLVDREETATGDGSLPSIPGPNLPDLRVVHHEGTTGAAFGALERAHTPR